MSRLISGETFVGDERVHVRFVISFKLFGVYLKIYECKEEKLNILTLTFAALDLFVSRTLSHCHQERGFTNKEVWIYPRSH